MAESFVGNKELPCQSIDNTPAVLSRITMPIESLYTKMNRGMITLRYRGMAALRAISVRDFQKTAPKWSRFGLAVHASDEFLEGKSD